MRKSYIAIVVAIILLIGGVVAYLHYQTTVVPVTTSDTASTTTKGPGYTITTVNEPTIRDIMPSLDRKVVFSADVPAAVRTVIQKHVDDDVVALKADPTRPGEWLDLALWYHTANDYEGSRLIWEFLVKAAPQDTTAYDNLGKLYHFDLHNFPKAEEYLLKSLAIDPKSKTPYVELFELYSLSYKKETSAAVDIMRKAEATFPDDPGLSFALGAYYRDQGKSTLARVEFLKALDVARAAQKLDIVSQVNAELVKLPQ